MEYFHEMALHAGPLACVFAAAFLQSATGFGLVMVMAPLLMYFYDAKLVILLTSLLALSGNMTQSILLRRHAHYGIVGWMILGAFCGQPVGLHIYQAVSPIWLKIVIGVIILLSLTLVQAFRLEARIRPRNSFITGFLAGTMAATTGMSGPPLILYFASAPFSPIEVRGSASMFFFLNNVVMLTTFFFGGVDFSAAVHEFIYVVPGMAFGIAAGFSASRRIPARLFRRCLFVILVVMCLHTIWGAWGALRLSGGAG